jgi:penicillin-binding protein 1A
VRFSTITNGQGANTALPVYGFYMNAAYADASIDLSQEDFALPEGIGLDSLDCRQWFELNEATFGSEGDDDLFQ